MKTKLLNHPTGQTLFVALLMLVSWRGEAEVQSLNFVTRLRVPVQGQAYADISRWTTDWIADEYRRTMRDPALLADQTFEANALFLIRKKEIHSLKGDVKSLLEKNLLTGKAEISALKTVFALGGKRDRVFVDRRISERLTDPEAIDASYRIGGKMTLAALQKGAETSPAMAHAAALLSHKSEFLAMPEKERAIEMTRRYMGGDELGAWGFKELLDHPNAGAIEGVRVAMAGPFDSIMPKEEMNFAEQRKHEELFRLRALYLLQTMKAPLTSMEAKFVMDSSPQNLTLWFRDWEDVLDGATAN